MNRVRGASQACLACLATLVQEDPRETEVTLGTKACQGWGFRDPWDQEGCQVYRGHRVQAHREPQEREDLPVSQVGHKFYPSFVRKIHDYTFHKVKFSAPSHI